MICSSLCLVSEALFICAKGLIMALFFPVVGGILENLASTILPRKLLPPVKCFLSQCCSCRLFAIWFMPIILNREFIALPLYLSRTFIVIFLFLSKE